MGSFTVIAIASLYLASTSSRGLFCPWMNLGWGMVVATPVFGILTYAFPNPLTLAAAMVLSLPTAFLWALSAAGAWHDFRGTVSVNSTKGSS